MEQSKTHHLQSVTSDSKRSVAKRKIEESDDGYDKELVICPTLKKNAASVALNLANKTKFYQCSLCPNSNEQLANVRKHVLRKHYSQPEVRIKQIDPDGTISTHTVDGLGTEYICDTCGRRYRDVYGYSKHCKVKKHQQLNLKVAPQEKQPVTNQLPITEVPLSDPIPLEAQLESWEPLTTEQIEEFLKEYIEPKP